MFFFGNKKLRGGRERLPPHPQLRQIKTLSDLTLVERHTVQGPYQLNQSMYFLVGSYFLFLFPILIDEKS